MDSKNYQKKYNEAKFNLNLLKQSFALGHPEFEHHLNNFLSSAQSVFWMLNKAFGKCDGYENWKSMRSERLSRDFKILKNLRNISLKEKPIEHAEIINGFDFKTAGISIPPLAEAIGPWLDTKTGKFLSNKWEIKTVEGDIKEVEPIVIHDFSVKVESDGKIIQVECFLAKADLFVKEIGDEILATEKNFPDTE